MKKILFAASEAVPFAKSGGLGDVIGSLPKAIMNQDKKADVRVIMPKYEDIAPEFIEEMEYVTYINVWVGWRHAHCGVFKLEYEGVTFYFIDNEYYFKRRGFYGYYDDGERFAFFCHSVLSILPHLEWIPDIIHCHDWQSAAVMPLLKYSYNELEGYDKIGTVQTIHNLGYQGIFPKSVLSDLLGLDFRVFTHTGMEFHNDVNFLKGGIAYADKITTVSKSYAEEIKNEYFGERLDGLLNYRSGDLYGILNGIDYDIYDPTSDEELFVNYSWRATAKRLNNKAKLQETLGLKVDKNIPLIGMVSRLVNSKGIDLVAHVLEEILERDVQFVILGAGEYEYESLFRSFAEKYPKKMAANISFSDSFARKVYAGSDMFLMPSRFEPCGIGQLIALRYGSIPIVREVGGLKDTVIPFNKKKEEGNGFTFINYNAHEMLDAIDKALKVYSDSKTWAKLVRTAMKSDYSWKNSANEYLEIYNDLIEKNN